MSAILALLGNFIMVRGFVEFSGSNEIFQGNSISNHFSDINFPIQVPLMRFGLSTVDNFL
jgi:hypothetical protein